MNSQGNSAALPDPRRWKALLLLCLANFMVIMDTSIIGVALPAVKDALGYSQTSLQWVFNAYVIAFGGFLLLGGRLSDLFGQRRLFVIGFVVLSASSLLAGLAWSDDSLNVGRALQGFGSALIAPAALTIVMMLFGRNPKELGRALGYWGASAAAGGTAGVFLGGVITEWLSWRWTFLINVPIGVIVLIAAPVLLSAGVRQKGSVDIWGALTSTLALVVSVYAIVTAEHNGWNSAQTIGLLCAAAILLLLFLIIQKVRKEPLVPLRTFSIPNLSIGNLSLILLAGAWIPLWYFLNLYLQQILNYSAFSGGLALVPMTVLIMILMVGVTGRLVGKFGFKVNLVLGMAILAGALFLFASNTPVGGSFLSNVLPASLLGALGMSLAYIPATIAAMSGAKPEETGLASGLASTSYQIGSALGLAIMVAIASAATDLGQGTTLTQEALNRGFHAAFGWAALIALFGALLALLFVRTPRQP